MGPRLTGREPLHDHVRILGVLYIICGALGLLVALLVVVIFGLGALGIVGAAAHEDPEAIIAIPIIGAVGALIVGFISVISACNIAAGFGVMNYRPWARILTIVLSAMNLPSVPLGTALGIYGLWVLLNKETEPLFTTSGAAGAPPPHPPSPQ